MPRVGGELFDGRRTEVQKPLSGALAAGVAVLGAPWATTGGVARLQRNGGAWVVVTLVCPFGSAGLAAPSQRGDHLDHRLVQEHAQGMRRRPLRCLVTLHKWARRRMEDGGDPVAVCARCGKVSYRSDARFGGHGGSGSLG